MSVAVICDNCKQAFEVKESVYRRQETFACSDRCRLVLLVLRNKSRSQYVALTCPQCQKIFQVRKCDVKKHRFCSLNCRSLYYHSHPQEHPQWEGGPVSKMCLVCGQEFRVKRSRSTKRVYCSVECYHASWGIKGFRNKPTKPERRLDSILNHYFLGQWKYTGDGLVRIGKRYPDFINCNGHKAVIEMFGDYWHGRKDKTWAETELGSIWVYSALGFKCLVIWEHELKDEQAVVSTVRQFMKSGRRTKI